MFANSVISRSSISISSLLLSSPLPPSLSLSLLLAFCSQSFLLVYVLPTRFFLSSGFARAASAIYERVVVMRCRVTSGLSAIVPSPFFSFSFSPPSVRSSFPLSLSLALSRLLSLHLSFILPCGSNVSVSSTLLHQPVERIRVTRHRSKYLPLAPSFSFLLQLFCRTSSLLCRTNLCSLLIYTVSFTKQISRDNINSSELIIRL